MIPPLASYRALPLLPIAIVVGVIVTCALVTLAFQNEIAHENNVFISQSHLIHEGVARRVTATEEVARSLALLFNASTQVDADEFRLFADDTLERLPFVRSVLYLPLVQDRDRRAFERGMREKGYETFSIKERRQDGPATAPRRDRYFPVQFIEPYGPAAAREIGRDRLAEPASEQAILWAIDTAGPVMSWPPEREPGAGVYTVLNATHAGKTGPGGIAGRRRAVNGIVAVRVNAHALLENLYATDHTLVTLAMHSPRTNELPVELATHQDTQFGEPGAWGVASLDLTSDLTLPGHQITLSLRPTLDWQALGQRLIFAPAPL